MVMSFSGLARTGTKVDFEMRRALLMTVSLLLPAVAAGCGGASGANFALGEQAQKLIPEARRGMQIKVEESDGSSRKVQLDGVEGWLQKLFGTPQELVAWQRLPVDTGGVTGEVTAVADGDPSSFTASFEVPPAELPEGTVLQWVDSSDAISTSSVARYDGVSQLITMTSELPEPPAVGTQFVVHAGSQLAFGRRLYMQHCMHCHGVSGDGQGPTARYLNPRPRDYRQGIFKFTSLKQKVRVNRDDLQRIVKYGIPGTYMPSFMLFTDEEFSAIVEYVRFLSMRGEMETAMTGLLAGDYSQDALAETIESGGAEARAEMLQALAEYLGGTFQEELSEEATVLAESWEEAESPESVIMPTLARVEDTEESRRRGRELYLGKKLDCKGCHGVTGEGNGPQTIAYQEIPGSQPAQKYPEPGLYDAWNQPIQPRNLTRGLYRGGRRPVDLYRRIHSGVKGTPMAGFANVLSEQDIWDLVNYVMSVPFEKRQSVPAQDAEGQVAAGAAAGGHNGHGR